MKTFEEKWTAWLDGQLSDKELNDFEASLPDLAAATRVWRDLFPNAEEVYTQGLRFIKEKWSAAS